MIISWRMLNTIRKMKVWKKTHRRTAQARGWKVIQTRRIDINQGDDKNPVHRSTLVGKEFNTGEMEGIFAGTPPLGALRGIVHEAATVRGTDDMYSKVTMVNDVSRIL